MKAEQLIRILVTITLVEMMAAIGMGVRLQEVGQIARDLRLLLRAAIANYASVPLVTVGLLPWFAPPPLISAGFLIVAVCPGAAYGPPFTAMARGNVAAAVGLMVILAGSSAICTPLLLRALLPMMAKGRILRVDVTRMVVMLLLTQLLPLSAGLALRQSLPALANRLKRPADALSATLNLSVLGLIVIARFEMLAATHLRAFSRWGPVVASMAVGGFGRPGIENRKAMTFSTGSQPGGRLGSHTNLLVRQQSLPCWSMDCSNDRAAAVARLWSPWSDSRVPASEAVRAKLAKRSCRTTQ